MLQLPMASSLVVRPEKTAFCSPSTPRIHEQHCHRIPWRQKRRNDVQTRYLLHRSFRAAQCVCPSAAELAEDFFEMAGIASQELTHLIGQVRGIELH